jgi:hypothetical protein
MNRYPTESRQGQPFAGTVRSMSLLTALLLAAITAGPHAVTAARAVVNLPTTAAAVAWGRAHGGTCELHDDLMVTCADMASGYSEGGTTVGNVWLYDDKGGPARHRHEARHADQWAIFGRAFPALYGADYRLADGDFKRSVFERAAGLQDGDYVR